MKASLVGAVAAISLIGAGSALAAPPAEANPSCVGRISVFLAQNQIRDDASHQVKATWPGPPGEVYSHIAREHEGSTVAQCRAEP